VSTVLAREAVRIGERQLPGTLQMPAQAVGLVVFAHGSGSSRLSGRNQRVAEALHLQQLATLLFDLLDSGEAASHRHVFDIGLLAARVLQALDWVEGRADLSGMPVGLFGASTGAAAALQAAAQRPQRIAAVVSRGGRPDLASDWLARVAAPTLLIVGGADTEVLDLNRRASRALHCKKRLEVVPGAGHLFEEPGALQGVAGLAAGWFAAHLGPGRP
jgi:putative phosphoribosyl transferase